MDILNNKSDEDLLRSLLAEAAKAANELKCAQADLQKAQSRLGFTLLLTNILLDRSKE